MIDLDLLTEAQKQEIYKSVKNKREKEWRKNKRSDKSKENRRNYMREYMKKYRAKTKQHN